MSTMATTVTATTTPLTTLMTISMNKIPTKHTRTLIPMTYSLSYLLDT